MNEEMARPGPRVTVAMPVYNGAAWIARALASLLAQSFGDWEAVVVDDGSTDATAAVVESFLADPRLRMVRHARNRGLGAAINRALDEGRGALVAYLPADDVWYADHLATLVAALDAAPAAALALSGVRYNYNRRTETTVPDEFLQPVQVLHRAGPLRWVERAELTTDDLDRMFWTRLREEGATIETRTVTCEWVAHPDQRHRVVREPKGGINPYRQRYGVAEPLVFHTTRGHRMDERGRYAAMRAAPTPARPDGLKILLVGELAYNAERVLALAERGHKLYGLWTPEPYWYNYVGPLPFGHVEELPREGWQEAVARLQPDVTYALLNWQAIPWAHTVMEATRAHTPFVWHFKEGPFIALEHGQWPQLAALHRGADLNIYSSAEMRDWTVSVFPDLAGRPAAVLDGDLPKRDWLQGERQPRLSDTDGEVHTVVPGRPIGLHPPDVAALGQAGVHLHFYGEFTQGQWAGWIEKTKSLAGRFIHLHANVDQERWVEEFSRYDAGWLHFFQSHNGGEIARADWDDLNIPARMATLGVCGVPMIQRDNTGHLVASQTLARAHGLSVFGRDMADVARQLHDRAAMTRMRDNVWARRAMFTFDAHADALVALLAGAAAARSGASPAADPLR